MTLMWNILKIVLLSSSTIRILYRNYNKLFIQIGLPDKYEEISDFIK
jgi:hypothetical protein